MDEPQIGHGVPMSSLISSMTTNSPQAGQQPHASPVLPEWCRCLCRSRSDVLGNKSPGFFVRSGSLYIFDSLSKSEGNPLSNLPKGVAKKGVGTPQNWRWPAYDNAVHVQSHLLKENRETTRLLLTNDLGRPISQGIEENRVVLAVGLPEILEAIVL